MKLSKLIIALAMGVTQAVASTNLVDIINNPEDHPEFNWQTIASFRAHPLYPYLQYQYFSKNLSAASSKTLAKFMKEHPHSPFAEQLAGLTFSQWLSLKNYDEIKEAYTPYMTNMAHRCAYGLVLSAQGHTQQLDKEFQSIWQADNNIQTYQQLFQNACIPLFSQQLRRGKLSMHDVVARFQDRLSNGKVTEAQAYLPLLSGENLSNAQLWMNLRNNPRNAEQILTISNKDWRAIILDDIVGREARKNTQAMVNLVDQVFAQHLLDNTDNYGKGLSRLAGVLARINDPRAEIIFAKLPANDLDKNAVYDVIAYELRNYRWQQLERLLAPLAGSQWFNEQPEVQYWLAKAYEKQGKNEKANRFYQQASKQRDFFGFLAAQKLGQPFALNDQPIIAKTQVQNVLHARPELYRLKIFLNSNDLKRANSEFNAMTRDLSDEDVAQAAHMIAPIWPVKAITTLGKIKHWNALNERFPLLYQDIIRKEAARQNIPQSNILAIIRKESTFQPTIASRVGAMGLMQVMPKTGATVAKQMGIDFTQSMLLDPNVNVQIGSQYLGDLLRRYGHLAYAAAGYNAGPSRVSKWLDDYPNLPLDEWIAQIPFNETRDYVKRVLEFEKIYEYRLQEGVKPYPQNNPRLW